MAKTEQVEVSGKTRSIPLLGGAVNYFRELREWYQEEQLSKREKQSSRRYVDAIFDCYLTGVIAGSQLHAKLPPLLEDGEYTRLGLNKHEVFAWAFHRTSCLYLDGYIPTLEAD